MKTTFKIPKGIKEILVEQEDDKVILKLVPEKKEKKQEEKEYIDAEFFNYFEDTALKFSENQMLFWWERHENYFIHPETGETNKLRAYRGKETTFGNINIGEWFISPENEIGLKIRDGWFIYITDENNINYCIAESGETTVTKIKFEE